MARKHFCLQWDLNLVEQLEGGMTFKFHGSLRYELLITHDLMISHILQCQRTKWVQSCSNFDQVLIQFKQRGEWVWFKVCSLTCLSKTFIWSKNEFMFLWKLPLVSSTHAHTSNKHTKKIHAHASEGKCHRHAKVDKIWWTTVWWTAIHIPVHWYLISHQCVLL